MSRFFYFKGVFIIKSWSYQILLDESYDSQSIRNLLQKEWLIPRRVVHFLRIKKHVLVNGSYHSINTQVKDGDKINLVFDESDFNTPIPPFKPDNSIKPDILFENDDLLVVNKPSGIKTHANQPGELGSMMNFLQGYYENQVYNAYNIHRLDQFTSGALLVAKNPVVIPILSREISQKIIKRTYLCVVSGIVTPANGTISLPIGLDSTDQRKRKINGINAQRAITHFKVLKHLPESQTLLQIQLETGRTHQIRVHLAHLGYPIVGDPLYNLNDSNGPMLLHSAKIVFPLPFSHIKKEINAPLPNYFPTNKKSSDLKI